MARDLSTLPQLHTAEEVIAFMQANPTDRVLLHSNDLDPTEYDERGEPTRAEAGILVIYSLSSAGGQRFNDLFNPLRFFGYLRAVCYGPAPGEIAVIAYHVAANGRRVQPHDIAALPRAAEDREQGRSLACARYPGLYVVPDHPLAERDRLPPATIIPFANRQS